MSSSYSCYSLLVDDYLLVIDNINALRQVADVGTVHAHSAHAIDTS